MSAITYDPMRWYWIVNGNTENVWSSASLTYVAQSDEAYVEWTQQEGAVTTRIASPQELSQVMTDQVVSNVLLGGLQIISTSTPAINSTYGLDDTTLNQISALARDAAIPALGFPGGASTFDYPDIHGAPHTFNADNMIDLYKALRDYTSSFRTAIAARIMGFNIPLPTQPVTIS